MKKIILLFCLFCLAKPSFEQEYEELINKSINYYSKGQFDKAKASAEKAVEMIKNQWGELSLEYGTSLYSLGALYLYIAEYEKAEKAIQKSIGVSYTAVNINDTIFSNIFFIGEYEIIDSLATIFQKMGEHKRAVPLYISAIKISKAFIKDASYYTNSALKLGQLYFDMGQYGEAELLITKTLNFLDSISKQKSYSYGLGLNILALVYEQLGKFNHAERSLLKSVDIIRQTHGEQSRDYSASLVNIGMLYYRLGEKYYIKADSFYKASGKIIEKNIATNPVDYAYYLTAPISKYASSGNFKSADSLCKLIDSVVNQFNLGTNNSFYANLQFRQATLFHAQNFFNKAEIFYTKAKNIEKNILSEVGLKYAWTLQGLGTLYMDKGQFQEAESHLSEKNTFQVEHLKNDFEVLSESGKTAYTEYNYFNSMSYSGNSLIYLYPKCSPSFKKEIFNLEVFSKSLILEHTKDLIEKIRNSKDTSVKRIFDQWKKIRDLTYREKLLPPSSRTYNIRELENRIDELESVLSHRSREFEIVHNTINIKLEDIRKKLQPDEVAVEFVRFRLYNKKWTDSIIYAAYILKKNSLVPEFVTLFEESQLLKLLDVARKKARDTVNSTIIDVLYRGLKLENKSNEEMRAELYSLVWKPLEPYLRGINKIAYSPAGKLHSIAFHALQIDSINILMNKYQLQQYTSTRQVALRSSENQNGRPKSISLFGSANFTMDSIQLTKQRIVQSNTSVSQYSYQGLTIESNNGPLPDLDSTKVEVKNIGDLFNQNKIYTETFIQTNASEENLKALDGKSPQILHIATHGFFSPEPDKKDRGFDQNNNYTLADDPLLRSGLYLAGANYALSGKKPIDGVEDGIVTAYEISQLDLSSTELVVLSACKTALGDVKGSEGVFGLQRAFKMAGVKKMIVSLWNVPDGATAKLMTAFYTNWIIGQTTIKDAFSQAQADMRTKYPTEAVKWAAFILVE